MIIKFRKNQKGLNLTKSGLILMLIIGLNLFGFLSIGSTTAFYNDSETSSGNLLGATSLDFSVDTEKQDDRFQTFTQGGWGSGAHGHNPGVYRDANFEGAFLLGAVIGLPDAYYSATFTDAEAVEDFLPAGGEPAPFTQDYVDPDSTEAGVLAGQVLALTLNIGFDLYDPDFAPSVNNLQDYVIHDALLPCDGLTVQQVLDEANSILGGLGSSFTPSEINECATWINEKFDEGGGDGGLVPGGSITQFATILNGGLLGFQYTVSVEKTSGDDAFCSALHLDVYLEGGSIYHDDLVAFVSSAVVYSASTDEWEFVISLPADSDVEGSCGFDFVYSGWQTNLETFGGFNDIERVDDPVHSAASVTVHSDDAEDTNQDEGSGSPNVQEQSLDNEPKVEEAITGEETDDDSGSSDDGDEPDVDTSTDETVADEEEVTEETDEDAENTEVKEEETIEENVSESQQEVVPPVEEEIVTTTEEEIIVPVEEEIKVEESVVEPIPEVETLPSEPPTGTEEETN